MLRAAGAKWRRAVGALALVAGVCGCGGDDYANDRARGARGHGRRGRHGQAASPCRRRACARGSSSCSRATRPRRRSACSCAACGSPAAATPLAQSTGPINPGGTASLKADLARGHLRRLRGALGPRAGDARRRAASARRAGSRSCSRSAALRVLATIPAMRRHRTVPAALALTARGRCSSRSAGPRPSRRRRSSCFARRCSRTPRRRPGSRRCCAIAAASSRPRSSSPTSPATSARTPSSSSTPAAPRAPSRCTSSAPTAGRPTARCAPSTARSSSTARAPRSPAPTLILRTPRFADGDDLCCPAKVVERVYAWSDGAKTLKQRGSRELPGPSTMPTTPAAAP